MKFINYASGSAGNLYEIRDGHTRIMIEAGLPWTQLFRAVDSVTAFNACLLSHEHGDHSRGWRNVHESAVDVYASAGTAKELGSNGEIKCIDTERSFRIGEIEVVSWSTVHDAAQPLGFLFYGPSGIAVYLADSAYSPYRFVSGLTHICIEANYSTQLVDANVASGAVDSQLRNRIVRNHMSIETAIEFLRANDLSRVQEIWLLHLSNTNSNAAEFAAKVRRATGCPTYVAAERGVDPFP